MQQLYESFHPPCEPCYWSGKSPPAVPRLVASPSRDGGSYLALPNPYTTPCSHANTKQRRAHNMPTPHMQHRAKRAHTQYTKMEPHTGKSTAK